MKGLVSTIDIRGQYLVPDVKTKSLPRFPWAGSIVFVNDCDDIVTAWDVCVKIVPRSIGSLTNAHLGNLPIGVNRAIMYMAELRGKLSARVERQEDILTSNVFSFFKYTNRQVLLKSFLGKVLGIHVSDEEAESAELLFWPRYADRTEPDLVIVVSNYYILIEAKYHSCFEGEDEEERDQLTREVRGGALEALNLDKEFYLVALTADYYYKPQNFQHVLRQLPPHSFKWISWQQIGDWLLETLEKENLSSTTRLFCQDLCDLLDKKNLRAFRDFKDVLDTGQILEYCPNVFFQSATATLRGDFIGFQNTLSAVAKLPRLPTPIFFQSRPLFGSLSPDEQLKRSKGRIFFHKGG